MSGLILAAFVVAFGFVTAAIATTVAMWVAGNEGQVSVSFANAKDAAIGLLFFVVSGPYLVVSNGMTLWRRGDAPMAFFGFCCLTALFWSFCLGVLMIQIFVSVGLLKI